MGKSGEADENGGLSYEEARKQRVEENKRRMMELGLGELSADLRNDAKSAKAANRPVKRRAPPSLEELGLSKRRSSRVAAGPAVDYKTQLAFDIPGLRGGRYTDRGIRTSVPRGITNEKARHEAIDAAQEIEKDLKNPAFVKPLLHSHVASCFWMGLPKKFCDDHLPKTDTTFVLEDEHDREWESVFLANKTGLSGGWRGFSLDHDLRDGDVALFELIAPKRFMVYIIRVANQPSAKVEVKEEEVPKKNEAKKPVGKKKPAKGRKGK